jgi:hypothetical protein
MNRDLIETWNCGPDWNGTWKCDRDWIGISLELKVWYRLNKDPIRSCKCDPFWIGISWGPKSVDLTESESHWDLKVVMTESRSYWDLKVWSRLNWDLSGIWEVGFRLNWDLIGTWKCGSDWIGILLRPKNCSWLNWDLIGTLKVVSTESGSHRDLKNGRVWFWRNRDLIGKSTNYDFFSAAGRHQVHQSRAIISNRKQNRTHIRPWQMCRSPPPNTSCPACETCGWRHNATVCT